MRGAGADPYPYDNPYWTNSTAYLSDNLLTGTTGSFAKNDAFYYMTGCNQIKVYAGGIGGAGADGNYRSFIFSFTGTNTPVNLMFTTSNAMSWNSDYNTWRSTFGQDRIYEPVFQRYGSPANQTITASRVTTGCGQPLMFGFNARGNGDPNDVNSGLGQNSAYCGGGTSNALANGNWSGSGGYVQIWAKGF
jgi:hypothetical protein